MKISIDLFEQFIGDDLLDITKIADELNQLGFEAEAEGKILDIAVPSNRGDCWNIYGLAKELSAFYGYTFKEPELLELPTNDGIINLDITDKAKDFVENDYFVSISNYRPTPSPDIIKRHLGLLNVSSKDLLVDLTNYITLEIGAPLHVFDKASIESGLKIDLSSANESMVLLNDKEVTLKEGMLIQRSYNQIIDLVGVMGGKLSGMDTNSDLIIQAGVFTPSKIRFNSKQSHVATEASIRYERGVSTYRSELALKRFLFLAKKYYPELEIVTSQKFQKDLPKVSIKIDYNYITKLLGFSVSISDLELLTKIGFIIEDDNIIVPRDRRDVESLADIAEEIVRFKNLNNIDKKPLSKQSPLPKECDYYQELAIKQTLVDIGFTEIQSYSFVEKNGRIKITNPISRLQSDLRISLKDGLLKATGKNPFLKKARFFEIGRIFLPDEKTHLGIILKGYKEKELTTIQSQLSEKLGLPIDYKFVDVTSEGMSYEIKSSQLYYMELPIRRIENKLSVSDTEHSTDPIKPISKFPPVNRDITFVVDTDDDITIITKYFNGQSYVLFSELIDKFESTEALGSGKIAYTFRVLYQDLARTLTDNETDDFIVKDLNNLSKELQFTIR